MKKLKVSSARRPLADYVADLRDETLLLTEGNRAVAAIVPLKNVDRESLALSQHPEFLELIAQSRADFSAGRAISLGEMKRRMLRKPARTSASSRRRTLRAETDRHRSPLKRQT